MNEIKKLTFYIWNCCCQGRIKARMTPRASLNPVIIGFGPAGMFASLELIDHGLKPVVFERGKKIEDRSRDISRFLGDRILDPESNIQFGEGGAGSYSDGKLFSRVNNTGYGKKVLDTFVRFGAPAEIARIRKPHLGTDVLCKIVRNIRNHIMEHGGKIHFSSKMTDLTIIDGTVTGVEINGADRIDSSQVYLAIGHSSRDTFRLLFDKKIFLEQKPITVGTRIEHPAGTINRIRYGCDHENQPQSGAATYSFTHTNRTTGRGVYSFCMCPGGEVLNASSEQGFLAVNGMSYSTRNSPFSNSAIVVTCKVGDYGSDDPLAGLAFQRAIEAKAFSLGGNNWKVPAQNLENFLGIKSSNRINPNSCKTGVEAVDMHSLFPGFILESLKEAFMKWKQGYPLFVSGDGMLLGAETRTSSPVRITRNDRFESLNIRNLYPIGEGAGYAGGITSSAIDAIRSVEAGIKTRTGLRLLR